MINIQTLRKEYTKEALDISIVNSSPIIQFKLWFEEALNAEVTETNAMVLSTISSENKPSARVVLLKGFDEAGFSFYTNYESKKGKELAQNPNACLTFFWPELERQVRIEGVIAKVSKKESDDYFAVRPKGSQIGAWASPQSTVIASRDILVQNQEALENKYAHKEVERPEHWGGYVLKPDLIEFWQGRHSRLHDRICYELQENSDWKIERLAP
jgi:pyridoxamine 5'-phosphate oxidase